MDLVVWINLVRSEEREWSIPGVELSLNQYSTINQPINTHLFYSVVSANDGWRRMWDGTRRLPERRRPSVCRVTLDGRSEKASRSELARSRAEDAGWRPQLTHSMNLAGRQSSGAIIRVAPPSGRCPPPQFCCCLACAVHSTVRNYDISRRAAERLEELKITVPRLHNAADHCFVNWLTDCTVG